MMKKIRSAKQSGKKNNFILRPNRLRMGLIYAFFFGVALVIGILIRFILDGGVFNPQSLFGDWRINFAIVFGGAVLFALLDYSRWTIRILGGEQLEGPSGAFGDRQIIPISEIDWTRTGRSLGSRFKIGNGIYARSRQRILISPWFYNPPDFDQFAQLIGYHE
jgi:hypothetical protein